MARVVLEEPASAERFDERAEAEAAFPSEPVRTLDALHLASGLVLRDIVIDLEIVSSDVRVRTNATQLAHRRLAAGAGLSRRDDGAA